jgi:zinc protease
MSKPVRETTRLTLAGGIPGYLEPSHALPLVSFTLALRSGAAHEPEDRGGVARLTARMFRRGAAGMTSREIEEAVDALGGEIAVDVGGSTMAFHGTVIRRNLDPFVDLVTRLLGSPTFDETELARLRRESLAELAEVRDNDRSLAQIAFRRALFAGHPFSRGSSGTISSIPKLGVGDLREFYAKHWVRGNAVLGFSGDLDEPLATSVGNKLLAALPDGPRVADDLPEPTVKTGRHLIFVDKPERTQTQIIIGSLGTSANDADHVPLAVANAIFGGTFTSRLMREIRSKRGWSYGASARLSVDRRRQSFSMWTFPAATDAAACIAVEVDLLDKWVTAGITPKELGFVKKYLGRSYAFDIDTASKRLHQALDVDLLGLPADYYSNYVSHVEAVTREGANAAVAKRISLTDQLYVVVGTAADLLPAVQASIPNLESTEVVPFDRD